MQTTTNNAKIIWTIGERAIYKGVHIGRITGKSTISGMIEFEGENVDFDHLEISPIMTGDNVTIIGRRWFDRINGNTYFSAVGLINNIEVVTIHYEYGYGDHYADRIFREMQKAGYMPDVEQYKSGGCESLWRYAERKGFTQYCTVSDVKRKKDL